jgi:putative membrane protein
MQTVLRIFLRDLKRILHNPVAVIVTLGVCVIPSLYAWFNILANWDPYKNTSEIPIAVVNQDQGAEVAGMGTVNAGDMVVEKLEENDQLGWTFPSEADGMEGVKAGRYYATIVIPDDFTQSLANVLDGNTDKAHLEYYVNEKVNAISPKVTDTGATTIERQIDDTFAGTVGKVIAEKLVNGSADVLSGADDAGASAEGKIRGIRDDLDALADQLDQADDTISDARDAVSSARTTVVSVMGTSGRATSSLRGALNNLGTTRSEARTLSSRLTEALTNGSQQVSDLSSKASGDVGALAGDAAWASSTFSNAIQRLEDELSTTHTLELELEDARSLLVQAPNAEAYTETVKSIDATLETLRTLDDDQRARLDELKSKADAVTTGANNMRDLSATLNNSLQTGVSALSQLQSDVAAGAVPQLSSALDSFSDVGNDLASSLGSLDPLLAQADATLGQLDGTLSQARTTIGSTSSQVRGAADALGDIADDLGTIRSTELWKQLQDASQMDPTAIGDYVNGPVQVEEDPIFPVKNYGSGVTPFYTNLALWVGGFVLVAIYKLEVDEEGVGPFRPWQGYLGRWLLLNLLGILQAVICCVGDLVLGIQCISPVAFVFAGVVESFVYVGFIYALSVAFKHIGKALGVLLVVLQIPGSSGTYPIEMMPGFFRALNPWLPFTYGINAMRESIGGFYGNYYAFNIGMLLLLVPISLLIGMGARRHLLNINTLFDRKLGETDLMIAERVPAGESQFKITTIIKMLINSQEYREVFLANAAKFELMYPTLIRRGFRTLLVVPVVLLALMLVLESKMVPLVLWIISLVVICTFLIVVEYLHARVDEKTALAGRSQDELLGMLDDKLRDELFAFAPIEKLHLTHESLADRMRALRQEHSGATAGAPAAPDGGDTPAAPDAPADPDATQPADAPKGGERDE